MIFYQVVGAIVVLCLIVLGINSIVKFVAEVRSQKDGEQE